MLVIYISQQQGPGTMYFYTMEYMEKYNEGLNLKQSDPARKMQSHSLGADYNGPGHRTVNLLGILKSSLLFSWLVGHII